MFTIPDPSRHYACRVDDRHTIDGVAALILQNELLQIVVLAGKGSEICQFLYKPQDVDFFWRAPNAGDLRPPQYPSYPEGATPFNDHWTGGWIEVLPNGGTAGKVLGAPFGFFAETTNAAWNWRILKDTPAEVSVGLWLRTRRTPFLLQKTLTLKSGIPALFIRERLTNEGHESAPFMWGHHPVLGEPFLDETCRIYAPACNVQVFHDEDGPDNRMGLFQTNPWPIIRDRNGGDLDLRGMPPRSQPSMDNCYLKDMAGSWLAVSNPGRKLGFALAWDPATFRYMWLWQALGGGLGYPWYGRTYAMGVEPWSSYPCIGLAGTVENGTALTLAAGQSLETWLTAAAYTREGEITGVNREGEVE
jgi:hypothetical protein